MGAFGWKDGQMVGLAEHDDLVLAWWFLDRAIRTLEEMLAKVEPDVLITGEELGIERVRIGSDY
jgi:hypothetical protein